MVCYRTGATRVLGQVEDIQVEDIPEPKCAKLRAAIEPRPALWGA